MRSRTGTSRLHLNARLVREKDRARARELRWLLLGCAAIALTLLVYVWQRVDFIRMSYEVEALKKEAQEQRELNEALRVERSLQRAPDRTIDELGGPVAHAGQPRPALAAIGGFVPIGNDREARP